MRCPPWTPHDVVLSRKRRHARCTANRIAAAPQSRPFDAGRCGRLAGGLGVPGADARNPCRSGCARAAAPITARPISTRAGGSRASCRRRSSACRSPRHSDRHRRDREERIDSLLALRALKRRLWTHPGNHHPEFPAESGNPHAHRPAPPLDELLWTIAIAAALVRTVDEHPGSAQSQSGRAVALDRRRHQRLGGVSPVTLDHVNPEAPWPALDASSAPPTPPASNWWNGWRSIRHSLGMRIHGSIPRCEPRSSAASTPMAGRAAMNGSPAFRAPLPDRDVRFTRLAIASEVPAILARAQAGAALGETEIVRLFRCRGDEFAAVCAAADELRHAANGDVVSYVVTRNINYTNICYFQMRILRLLQRQAERELARPAVRTLAYRGRTARARGVGAPAPRSLHAGRDPSSYSGRHISRDLPGCEKRCPGHPHPRVFAARSASRRRNGSACRSRSFCARCKRRGSARYRARRRKSSTMRCAPCFARTRSIPGAGSR